MKPRLTKHGMCDYPSCTKSAAAVVISVFPSGSHNRGSTRARFCCLEHAIGWMHILQRKQETMKDRQ